MLLADLGVTKTHYPYRYKASKQDCDTCPAKDQCCPRTKHGRSIERGELLPGT